MKQNRNIILFDTPTAYRNLLPLSYTRPLSDFRVGITTLREKWQSYLPGEYSFLTVDYLQDRFPCKDAEISLYIAGNVVADKSLADAVSRLEPGEKIVDTDGIVAYCGRREDFDNGGGDDAGINASQVRRIRYVYDIFLLNSAVIQEDYRRIIDRRASEVPDRTTMIIGDMRLSDGRPALFIEEGATVEGAIISLKDGPVYIGKNAYVMPGATIKGPVAVCDNAKVRMGAKVYGGCTFGPYCKVGGELDNVVMFGYSNKAHEGYLGNAVIGEWCNIGAGTSASNLKNDYSKIRIWNYESHTFMRTSLQFCGLIMGDHSKAGINCMFNTATVVGVGVNVHGSGFPRVFIPSFSEGSPEGGFSNVRLNKFYEIAARVMARRDLELTEIDRRMFERIYEMSLQYKG